MFLKLTTQGDNPSFRTTMLVNTQDVIDIRSSGSTGSIVVLRDSRNMYCHETAKEIAAILESHNMILTLKAK